jgi:hypothetical protein
MARFLLEANVRRQSRMPKLGDLIIETRHHALDRDGNKKQVKHVGLVYHIKLDPYGHQRNVYIEWTQSAPPHYRKEHGYAGVNIHNSRREYSVIRDGKEIE